MNETENTVNASKGTKFRRKLRPQKLLFIPYIIFCGYVASFLLGIIEEEIRIYVPGLMQLIQGYFALVVFLLIFLSPLGEAISRKKCHCRPITDEQLRANLDSIYREAFEKAKISNPKLKDKVKLYMNDEKSPNAVAVGTRSICMTRGLMNRPRNQIVAVLAHELSHIAYKDTALSALMSAGNLCVKIAFFLWKAFFHVMLTVVILLVYAATPSKDDTIPKKTLFIDSTYIRNGSMINGYHSATIGYQTGDVSYALASSMLRAGSMATIWTLQKLRRFISNLPFTIWSVVMVVFTSPVSRAMEYDADEFTQHTGLGNDLCEFLKYIHDTYFQKKQSFMERLSAAHPDPQYRIKNLQKMNKQS